jgi:hypothetical protein
MTDEAQAFQSPEPVRGNLGRFVGVLEITEPTGEKRLVEFEADVGSASLVFGDSPPIQS